MENVKIFNILNQKEPPEVARNKIESYSWVTIKLGANSRGNVCKLDWGCSENVTGVYDTAC